MSLFKQIRQHTFLGYLYAFIACFAGFMTAWSVNRCPQAAPYFALGAGSCTIGAILNAYILAKLEVEAKVRVTNLKP